MNKFERLKTVIAGRKPDRIPAAVWFHFGGGFLSPEDQARYYLKVVVPQDWDFLKVMFEYRPRIDLELDLSSPSDLLKLLNSTDWEEPFRLQRECLKILAAELEGRLPILESGYSPWFSLFRWIGRDLEQTFLVNRNVVSQILDRLTKLTCEHVQALKKMNISGYFYATIAASRELSPQNIEHQTDHDRQILEAGQGLLRVLHLHGNAVELERVSGYAFEVLNYSDQHPSNPSLAQARQHLKKCLMGGICEQTLTKLSVSELKRQIKHEIQQSGDSGLIISPGCAISPSVSASQCSAILQACK
ncbi:uroporphyrinogen decarboxylase family protein [Limnobacter sp.]|uniref:uroporphyrinogen decarboxylase family protein n=1 Tax=Limnobacter sp. TaxID=2003368 RepID=UPI0027B92862|nr:uroporphyrinogen decarboxylase family protein [Limnobacter sp.]